MTIREAHRTCCGGTSSHELGRAVCLRRSEVRRSPAASRRGIRNLVKLTGQAYVGTRRRRIHVILLTECIADMLQHGTYSTF